MSLLPQGSSLSRSSSRQQEGARRGFTKPRREQRGGRQLPDDQLLHLVRIDQQLVGGDRVDGLGEAQHDAVVTPQHFDRRAEPLGEPSLERKGPRRVHPRAERRQHAHAPIADLVGEAFDDDRAVVG